MIFIKGLLYFSDMQYRKYQKNKAFLHLLTMPFIWAPLPFAMALDLVLAIYQWIAFPIYGLEKVKRSEYILIMDRQKLSYLKPLEKLGCMYCGYMNGLFVYLKEIAGRTEKYWCGIMHQKMPGFKTDPHQVKEKFARFDDRADFYKKYPYR